MNDSHFSEGQASVSPDESVQAGSPGAWTITYVVGESGMSPGDAVRVTVPTGFSAPQTDSPVSPGYVSAESGNLASAFRIALEPLPGSVEVDLREEAGDQAIYLFLERGPLHSGEMLQVHYGSGEGGAFTSPYSGTAEFSVWVSVRASEDVAFRPLAASPSFDVRPGTVSTLEAIAPSSVAANSSFDIRIVARDTLGNRCRDWSGWFAVQTDAEGVRIPHTQRHDDPTGEGIVLRVRVEEGCSNPLRLTITDEETGIQAMTNPILVGTPGPIWGDLHACVVDSDSSVPELDFELAVGATPTLNRTSFTFQLDQDASTILRYSLPDRGNEEILSSHLLEVYSCWGNREEWGGRNSDIRIDRHPSRTCQAVLDKGVVAGFAAGSNSRLGVGRDAVRAEAGRGYAGGLTAVCSASESQEAIFEALRERRCYATTGHRPLIDFSIDSYPMGSLVEVKSSNREILAERKIRATVKGTALIERIEVIRNNTEVCTYRGENSDVAFEWNDQQDLSYIALHRKVRGWAKTCYYYLRITQADGEMVWTSPIWFVVR
jgi:hypothetical protein